jgi:hypothetical protein
VTVECGISTNRKLQSRRRIMIYVFYHTSRFAGQAWSITLSGSGALKWTSSKVAELNGIP